MANNGASPRRSVKFVCECIVAPTVCITTSSHADNRTRCLSNEFRQVQCWSCFGLAEFPADDKQVCSHPCSGPSQRARNISWVDNCFGANAKGLLQTLDLLGRLRDV